MNKRIFVYKKAMYDGATQKLMNKFKEELQITNLTGMIKYNVYDIFNIDKATFEVAKTQVFAEATTDIIVEELDVSDKVYLAIETLPNQFDMRASSANECLRLINPASNATVRSAEVLVFEGITQAEVNEIANYYLNPIECRQKDMSVLEIGYIKRDLSEIIIEGFTSFNDDELANCYAEHGFSFSFANFKYIQAHFTKENRDPLLGELLIIDTYWSDHCRHTTFNTELTDIEIKDCDVKQAFNEYLELKDEIVDKKPISLMNLGTIYGKYAKKKGLLTNLEDTIEDNAISMEVTEGDETFLMQFKNETHNHPTEIEPFGGASTCIGGAIRDPLSGRAYVYQGMRISGGASILEQINETMENKLPQRVISQKSCDGFSSYGNQIGLATTYVRELYHPGYKAKHLEAGAVVGAVNKKYVTRKYPKPGDIVVLIGGATGFDGIGGATGSSKSHHDDSLSESAVEVQKGNAPVERKIQRLFMNEKAIKLIKKSNDFGAGGVSVAIGELSDSIEIYLEKIPLKAQNLKPSEIALSESQERMAVVIDANDFEMFKYYASLENLTATKVALVTKSNRLVMKYYGDVIIDLDRDFLNSSGVVNKQAVKVNELANVKVDYEKNLAKLYADECLVDNLHMDKRFDATVGATTVLMPYGGKYQLTKNQTSVQKIPGTKELVSMISFGFNPELTDTNPYYGAMSAVVDSVTKLIATGASLSEINLSFQEYFMRLNEDKEKYGVVVSALLGALKAQKALDTPALGGKDSMSGTFNELDVPATLISFAFAPGNINQVVSTEIKAAGEYIYLLKSEMINNDYDFEQIKENYQIYTSLVKENKVTAGAAVTDGGIALMLSKMLMGNKLGCDVKTDVDLYQLGYGDLIFTSKEELNILCLGKTTATKEIKLNNQVYQLEDLIKANDEFFTQVYAKNQESVVEETKQLVDEVISYRPKYKQVPRVFIPVFSGTNSELEMSRAFLDAGCEIDVWVFKNQTEEQIKDSIEEMVHHIKQADIIALSGGFSGGDEPDGSGKYIVNILANSQIKVAMEEHLAENKLILGICNGFQALIKSGLITNSKVEINENNPTLFHNDCGYHLSQMVEIKVVNKKSPWLNDLQLNDEYTQVISHGEGKVVCSEQVLEQLVANKQVAFTYSKTNPNGSYYDIEGLISPCGKVLGKMAHSERYVEGLYQNIPGNKQLDIFTSAVNYFKNGER